MVNKKDTQADERAALIAGTAPPPYSELPAASSSSSTQQSHAPAPAQAHHSVHHSHSPSPSGPAPRPYPSGPTAFAALPAPTTSTYAHVRAMHAADRRARRRFCAALCWGFVLYVALGMLIGGIVGEEMARHSGNGDWSVRRVAGRWWRGSETDMQEVSSASSIDCFVPPDPSYAIM
ncbi:hypothetical protein JCM11251_000170 [Rhodosporidiobolus azoricus]